MNLWIRSQNRMKLVNVNKLNIVYRHQWAYDVYSDNFIMGTYSTEENALKVLDMIQEAIVPKLIIDVDGRVEKVEKMVFEMPKEEEVIL